MMIERGIHIPFTYPAAYLVLFLLCPFAYFIRAKVAAFDLSAIPDGALADEWVR